MRNDADYETRSTHIFAHPAACKSAGPTAMTHPTRAQLSIVVSYQSRRNSLEIMYNSLILLFAVIAVVSGHKDGAPISACLTMSPGHENTAPQAANSALHQIQFKQDPVSRDRMLPNDFLVIRVRVHPGESQSLPGDPRRQVPRRRRLPVQGLLPAGQVDHGGRRKSRRHVGRVGGERSG